MGHQLSQSLACLAAPAKYMWASECNRRGGWVGGAQLFVLHAAKQSGQVLLCDS